MTHGGPSTIASTYDEYWTDRGFQPPSNRNPFLDASIGRASVPGSCVADFGCGDGRTVGDRVAVTQARYIGIDVSRSGIAAAVARGLDARLVDDISESGLDDGSMDAVFIIEVLEHLLDPASALAEARRVLRPGGRVFVTVPNAAVWPRRWELAVHGRPNGMGDDLSRSEPWRDPHIRSFTVASLGDLLRRVGFLAPTVSGTEPVPAQIGERSAQLRPQLFARRVTAMAIK